MDIIAIDVLSSANDARGALLFSIAFLTMSLTFFSIPIIYAIYLYIKKILTKRRF